jgi:hypothetical protein
MTPCYGSLMTNTIATGSKSVALVTDSTPDYMEFGDYRGWVVLAEDGTYLQDISEQDVAQLAVTWDEGTNGEYARTGTISDQ